jgi:hypothetical protein
MPDIEFPRSPARKLVTAGANVLSSVDTTLHGPVMAALIVATLAVLLAAARIELQYVVGAFVIVFSQGLARKRFTSTPARPTADDLMRMSRTTKSPITRADDGAMDALSQ